MKKLRLLWIAGLAGFLISCGNDDEGPSTESHGAVLVVNEGNFGQSNGSISSYNPGTDAVTEHIFETANSGRPLGDVVQSMVFDAQAGGYVVVNNSRKIEVVNADFVSESIIESDLANPRFLVEGEGRLFISNWGNFDENFLLDQSYVLILDAGSLEKTGMVETEDGTENLLYSDGYVYASNSFGNTVTVIDVESGSLNTTLEVGYSPGEMVLDNDGTVWLICGGTYQGNDGAIYHLTPSAATKEIDLALNPATKLAVNTDNGLLYYISGTTVGSYDISAATLDAAFISQDQAIGFYGIGYSPSEGVLYVADAKGFQGKGQVYRYAADGVLISSFDAGVGPNGFVFTNE